MLGKVEITGRGFEIIHFNDCYDEPCSLQQSSLAEYDPPGSSAIWLGVGNDRMHLKVDQVEDLIKVLENWVRDGSFSEKKP